jgi:hypothetical protein
MEAAQCDVEKEEEEEEEKEEVEEAAEKEMSVCVDQKWGRER